ncbi:MAG: glutamate-1-semialdehyde 2,1-aminomutase [Deltaproteobacteria bacterium]|nr:glutamate-1-semialdehyde 2,1-aminomutase [Candidatus Zymogenaceae bacterium]
MTSDATSSKTLLSRAEKIIPGGVNSPVRAFRSVGGTPPFISRGKGCRLFDVDGHEYIDYVLSWGPLILGHAHEAVVDTAIEAARGGSSFGAPTEAEVRFAELVVSFFPSMEMLRLVSSGTEAAMTAIRLARGYTGRDIIIKFEGCYHGHVDSLLAAAGSGAATLGIPSTPGVTPGTARDTVTVPFNDLEALEGVFTEYAEKVAAVIVEPVPGNMGVVPPVEGYLPGILKLARKNGALVIFDEVMSGFRADLGGAQTLFGLDPDLTMLGKVVGGGYNLAAVGGRRDIMESLAPVGDVYQAGTLSGNPVAVAAGLATLLILKEPGLFSGIVEKTERLVRGILLSAEKAGVPMWGAQVGTMACLFFTDSPVRNFVDAKNADGERFKKYFHAMLKGDGTLGHYFAPSAFEALFVSAAHTGEDIETTIRAAAESLSAL